MTIGWGTAIGAIFGKVMTYIPGRIEKLKNELSALQKEKNKLLMGECDEKKANRLEFIDNRIIYLTQLMKNKVSD